MQYCFGCLIKSHVRLIILWASCQCAMPPQRTERKDFDRGNCCSSFCFEHCSVSFLDRAQYHHASGYSKKKCTRCCFSFMFSLCLSLYLHTPSAPMLFSSSSSFPATCIHTLCIQRWSSFTFPRPVYQSCIQISPHNIANISTQRMKLSRLCLYSKLLGRLFTAMSTFFSPKLMKCSRVNICELSPGSSCMTAMLGNHTNHGHSQDCVS